MTLYILVKITLYINVRYEFHSPPEPFISFASSQISTGDSIMTDSNLFPAAHSSSSVQTNPFFPPRSVPPLQTPDLPSAETAPPAYLPRDVNASPSTELVLTRLEQLSEQMSVGMATLSSEVGALSRSAMRVDRNLQILRIIVGTSHDPFSSGAMRRV